MQLFQQLALLAVAVSAMYDGPKFGHRKPDSNLTIGNESFPSLGRKKPINGNHDSFPSFGRKKPINGNNDSFSSLGRKKPVTDNNEHKKPKVPSSHKRPSWYPKPPTDMVPMEAHNNQDKPIKRVIVTKIVMIKPKPITNGNSSRKSDMDKVRDLQEMTERMMREPEAKWWPIGKPKKDIGKPRKDHDDDDKNDDDSGKKHKKMISEFYKRRLARQNRPKKPTRPVFTSHPHKKPKKPTEMGIMDSEILDMAEGDGSSSPYSRKQAMRSRKPVTEEEEEEDEDTPYKKSGFFERIKKRVENVFNSSLDDPVARFIVALSLGLMTTLSVFAVAALAKMLLPKLFGGSSSEEHSDSSSTKYEYGGRTHSNVQYTPLPQ